MPNPEMESLLRERIDDLSTRLLIEGPGADGGSETFQAALAELSRQAGGAGYRLAARIAGELSASPPLAAELQEGLARLQQALSEDAGGGGPAPAAPERPKAVNALAEDPELV